MKSKPDMVLVLALTFALGVMVTMATPMSVRTSVAAPASPLQAGIVGP